MNVSRITSDAKLIATGKTQIAQDRRATLIVAASRREA